MLPNDLFEFAYLPRYQEQLDALEGMCLPESWRFSIDDQARKNIRNPILSNHIRLTFRRISYAYNAADISGQIDRLKRICYWSHEMFCFHTGLFTPQYNAIFAVLAKTHSMHIPNEWMFRGFYDEGSYQMVSIMPLPVSLQELSSFENEPFHASLPLRINVRHMLEDEKNFARIPEKLREFSNLRMLLEAGVHMAIKQAMVSPSRVVPHLYHSGVQY